MADEPIRLPIEADTANAQSDLRKLSGTLKSVGKVGTAAVGAIVAAAVAAAGAYKELLDSTTEYIDTVNTQSAATGLARETIAGLNRAAVATGKSLEDLVPKDLAQKMLQAEQGSKRALKGFAELGLSQQDVIDLNGDVDATFRIVIDRLGAMDDKGRAAGIAAQLLGENGRQMLSAFGDSEDLDAFVDQAEKFGIDVGPEAVEQTAKWQQATSNLDLALENVQSTAFELFGSDTAVKWLNNVSIGTVAATEYFKFFFEEMSAKFTAFKDSMYAVASAQASLITLDFEGALKAMDEADFETLVMGTEDFDERLQGVQDRIGSFIQTTRNVASETSNAGDKLDETGDGFKGLGSAARDAADDVAELDVAFRSLSFLHVAVGGATEAIHRMTTAQDEATFAAEHWADNVLWAYGLVDERADQSFQERMGHIHQLLKEETASTSQQLAMTERQTDFIIQNLNTQSAAGKAAAIALFTLNKLSAIGQATINTALGITQALGSFPPPASFVFAGITAALGAVQVGIIAAEQPKFHIGTRATSYAPDEIPATLTKHEQVFTALGDEALTKNSAANANAGVSMGQNYATVILDHRAAGEMVSTQLRPGTALTKAIRRGEPRGHRRKRGTRG